MLLAVAYRAVLLDFYGTVVEEDDAIIESIVRKIGVAHPNHTADELGRLWGQEFASLLAGSYGSRFRSQRDLARTSLTRVLERLGSGLNASELVAEQFDYWRRPSLRPGAAEFIASCPVPICIVSNIDTDDLRAAIAHTGLSLPIAVTSEQARSYKPRPEPYTSALDALDLSVTDVVHVGDSVSSDIAGANALGIDAAWVNPNGRTAPEGAQIRLQLVDLRELRSSLLHA